MMHFEPWFWPEFFSAINDTLYMVIVGLIVSIFIGLPIGVILVVTREGGIIENKALYNILNVIINIFRSIPFIILLVAIIPFTRLIVGTTIGTTAAIVPLVLHIGPYMARLVENSLLEVNEGIIEAAQAMGASKTQIVFRFLIPEAFPSLILS